MGEQRPFSWAEFGLQAGKDRLLHQEAPLFLWCLHCDISTPFSPLHLDVWHKVETNQGTEMELCHRWVLDRKIWGIGDDLCLQRNREGRGIGKEIELDWWWVGHVSHYIFKRKYNVAYIENEQSSPTLAHVCLDIILCMSNVVLLTSNMKQIIMQ